MPSLGLLQNGYGFRRAVARIQDWLLAKAARKALISDGQLCKAIAQVRNGQCDDLGGGVFKKRLDKNRHRNVILAKGERYWVYEYLFAKKDRDNIDADELVAFRGLAKGYAALGQRQISRLLEDGDWLEICHEHEA